MTTLPTIFVWGPPAIADHNLVRSGLVVYMPEIGLDPWGNVAEQARFSLQCWDRQPVGMPVVVRLGFVGVEDFDVDREDGAGCTLDAFKQTISAGIGQGTRDRSRLAEAAAVWKAAGTLPDTINVASEPTTMPVSELNGPLWADVLKDNPVGYPTLAAFTRNASDLGWCKLNMCPAYDAMRVRTFRTLLSIAGLWNTTKAVSVDWTAFNTKGDGIAYDYNTVPIAFGKITPKFEASAQFYGGHRGLNALLGQWLHENTVGAMPFLDAVNWSLLRERLVLCGRAKARPIVFIQEGWQGTGAFWQMDQLAAALAAWSN